MLLTLPISAIVRDPRAQKRAKLDEERIEEYMECLDALPPVKVTHDEERYYIWDGFHTTEAHVRAGRTEIRAEAQPGDLRAAILLSCGANAEHGLPRTREDKRRAVLTLLEDPEWQSWSNVAIAKACRVDEKMVRRLRDERGEGEGESQTSAEPKLRRGLDGKVRAVPATSAEPKLGAAPAVAEPAEMPRFVSGPPSPFMARFDEITRVPAVRTDPDCLVRWNDQEIAQTLDDLIARCPQERRRQLAELLQRAAERVRAA